MIISFLNHGWEVTRTISWRTSSQLCSPCEALSQHRLAHLPWHITAELQLLIDIAQRVSVTVSVFRLFWSLKRVMLICQMNNSCCGGCRARLSEKGIYCDGLCKNKCNQQSVEPGTKEVTVFLLSMVCHWQPGGNLFIPCSGINNIHSSQAAVGSLVLTLFVRMSRELTGAT